MPFNPDHHRVTLETDGIPVLYASTYEIQQSILQQPAAFALQLGGAFPLRDLIDMWPPNTAFRLSINGCPQFTGRTDGWTAGVGSGGSGLTLRGRDTLAPLVDSFATAERSFSDLTFEGLVNKALTEVHGLSDAPTLIYTNEANRKAVTGVAVRETAPPAVGGIDPDVWAKKPAMGKQLQIKMGQRWFSDLVKPELDRAGLFLWAAGDGTLILSTPNTAQDPVARIFRKDGHTNILQSEWRNEPTARYSRCDVHCRSAGGDKARVRSFATFADDEMAGWGIARPLCIRDDKAKTIQQAEFLARRRIAEARRAGWALTYTLTGHTAPSLVDGSPAVWAPDTVVEVDDDLYGITDRFWVESVRHASSPESTTTVTLMRLSDVIFGSDPSA